MSLFNLKYLFLLFCLLILTVSCQKKNNKQEANEAVQIKTNSSVKSLSSATVFSRNGITPVTTGQQIPNFTYKNLERKNYQLSHSKNKIILLHFWATWCPPCIRELPNLERMNQLLKRNNFELITISADEKLDTVKAFMEKHNYTFKVGFDPEMKIITGKFNVSTLPTSIITDRAGKVIGYAQGEVNWNKPELVQAIKNISQTK